jgi:phi LC3 family holin
MKINWKARLRNKPFLLSFSALIIAFAYQILGIFDIVPSISEDNLIKAIGMLINIFAVAGVVVDPTTKGMQDSDRAMTYYNEIKEEENNDK